VILKLLKVILGSRCKEQMLSLLKPAKRHVRAHSFPSWQAVSRAFSTFRWTGKKTLGRQRCCKILEGREIEAFGNAGRKTSVDGYFAVSGQFDIKQDRLMT
jgi:hypothetical protein